MKLVYKHESSLWTIAAVLSSLIWLLLVLSTFGIALIYLVCGYLFFLFTHSAFIAWLKGTGVKITAEQYPDLHQRLLQHCQTLDIREIPEAYLLRTDFFNAMATRFMGRHFVVLYSDVVDALETHPDAIDFYIGHELGHIHRKHLLWGGFLAPARLLPLLGAALRRSEEYTCDRYGVACCESEDDIKAAIAAMAAGNSRWSSINVDAYMQQVASTNGFWMSFHELTGDYPWLTKRMAAAVALKRGVEIHQPTRHPMAWMLAALVPRLGIPGAGGVTSLVVMVAIIGILSAVAIPQYENYRDQARYSKAIETMEPVRLAIHQYILENNAYPQNLQQLGFADDLLITDDYSIELYDYGVLFANMGMDMYGEDIGIVMQPNIDSAATASGNTQDVDINLDTGADSLHEDTITNTATTATTATDNPLEDDTDTETVEADSLSNISSISWSCYGENLNTEKLPEACRS